MDGTPVVAGGAAADVLELAEASLDPVAVPGDGGMVRDGALAAAVRGDDRFGIHRGDERAQTVAVAGPAGEDGVPGLAVEQGRVPG